jgi:hypothetical protein
MSDTSGYALRRNGSCLSTETDCGLTTSPFHACCPGNTFCPGPQYNVICCPSDADCSNLIGKKCADSKADLYSSTSDVASEGFCCERGKYAFTLEDQGVGCADRLSDLQVSMTQLGVISSASGTYSHIIRERCRLFADDMINEIQPHLVRHHPLHLPHLQPYLQLYLQHPQALVQQSQLRQPILG